MVWDNILCWDAAPSGTVQRQSCPDYINQFDTHGKLFLLFCTQIIICYMSVYPESYWTNLWQCIPKWFDWFVTLYPKCFYWFLGYILILDLWNRPARRLLLSVRILSLTHIPLLLSRELSVRQFLRLQCKLWRLIKKLDHWSIWLWNSICDL